MPDRKDEKPSEGRQEQLDADRRTKLDKLGARARRDAAGRDQIEDLILQAKAVVIGI